MRVEHFRKLWQHRRATIAIRTPEVRVSESTIHSISQFLSGVKRGDQAAIREVFDRCFDQLVRLAKARLGGASRRVADEEDVALSVFQSLCRGAAAGRFERMRDRDELWQLLMTITQQKVVDHKRHNLRQKRGSGEVRGDSIFQDHEQKGSARGIEEYAIEEMTPHFLCALEDEHQRLLGLLRDDGLRRIALMRMEGYQDDEIATELGISLRTVERKLQLIREKWAAEIKA